MSCAALLAEEAFRGCIYSAAPRNVYWEMTVACGLACQHCRASAIPQRDPLELTFEEGCAMIRDIRGMGSMLILTGGDPMLRPDLFELIAYARSIGVPVSITPSATPSLTREAVQRFKELGVAALGISLDAPTAELHDSFRGVSGTFARSLEIFGWAREFRLPVQVNTTVTRSTLPTLEELYRLLCEQAVPPVKRWSLFLLVPVGRGARLGLPSAGEVEDLWAWVYQTAREAPFHVATVEAPHYRRYWVERRLAEGATLAELERAARSAGLGIRDGNGVIFVSHRGEVYPAGFLPYPVGNVRERLLSEIYRHSPALIALRDMNRLKGKCRRCAYRWACGGSRARAFAMSGDPFASDPLCAYEPRVMPLNSATNFGTPDASATG